MILRGSAAVLAPFIGQASISFANLLLGIVLIREGSPYEYGLFVLGLSIALFFVGLQDGLVSVPVMVRAGSLSNHLRISYLLWNRRSLYTVTAAMAVAGTLCAELLVIIVPTDITAGFVVAVACAGSCWIAWDYQRCEALARRSPGILMRIDLSYFFAVALGASVIARAAAPTATLTLFVIAGAALLAACVGIGRTPVIEFRWRIVKRAMRLWWNRGRFSLFASLISWVQSQGYIYVCSGLLGLEALARIAAARLLFAPLNTVLAAWVKVSTTRCAERYQAHEFVALTRHLTLAAIGFALLTAGWCGLILYLQGGLLDVMFKSKYNGMTGLIVAWALALAANSWRTVWQTGLRVAARYLWLTRLATAGAGTSILVALAAMQWYGEIGAVIGLAAGEALVASLAFVVFRSKVVNEHTRAI